MDKAKATGPATIDPHTLADFLGVPLDDRMHAALEASMAWVRRRRSLVDPAVLFSDADVALGTVMYAGLLYTSRAQPQGFPGLDDLGGFGEDTGMSMAQVHRLIGVDQVVA